MIEEEKRPWERQKGETTPAFDAFTTYRDLGKERSLAKVGNIVGKSKTLMDRWSSRNHWVDRVQAYDDHLEKLALDTKEQAIQDMLERHTKMSMMFQNKVIEGLKSLKSETLTASDLVRIFEASVKVERLSRGVADVVDETKLQQNQEKLELDKAKANMDEKSLEENSGFLNGLKTKAKDVWISEREKVEQ